ncbi:MAG: hypothetical protein ACYSUT_09380 [Planctomycetota bacterium]
MSDLQPSQSAPPSETQFIFSILTYELDNSSRDQLSMVFRWLSRRQIQYADKAAFDANGFTAAWAGHEKGTKVAQALAAIGAQRVRHGRLITSADMHETIWDEPIEAQTITFPISHRRTGRVSLGQGRLGWLLSPRFDPDQRQLAHIQLEPAFWTEGMSDLRALEGKIPYKYQTFQSGRFSLTLEPGDICVLAPSGSILQQQTLSRMLFEADEQRTRLFVIVLERAGN